MDKDTLRQLEEANWAALYPRLVLYASRRMNRLYWKDGAVPKGFGPEDIAQEAVTDVLGGVRKWDAAKDPDLYLYLKSVVNSKISKLLELKEYRVTQRFPVAENGVEKEELLKGGVTQFDEEDARRNGPENALLEKEEQEQAKEIVGIFLDGLKGDNELEELAACIMEGITKPAEIAAELGVPVADIYRRKKRFDRACERFAAEFAEEELRTNGLQET